MICKGCNKDQEIVCDVSDYCYECTDWDPDSKPDLVTITILAAKSAFGKIINKYYKSTRKVDTRPLQEVHGKPN